MKVKTGGTAVGIAYWFTLHMYGGITISTYQPEAVSRSDLYLWKFLITKLSIHACCRVQATGIRVCFSSLRM